MVEEFGIVSEFEVAALKYPYIKLGISAELKKYLKLMELEYFILRTYREYPSIVLLDLIPKSYVEMLSLNERKHLHKMKFVDTRTSIEIIRSGVVIKSYVTYDYLQLYEEQEIFGYLAIVDGRRYIILSNTRLSSSFLEQLFNVDEGNLMTRIIKAGYFTVTSKVSGYKIYFSADLGREVRSIMRYVEILESDGVIFFIETSHRTKEFYKICSSLSKKGEWSYIQSSSLVKYLLSLGVRSVPAELCYEVDWDRYFVRGHLWAVLNR